MKDFEILADMCLEINDLLDQLYRKGIITKETYEEHTRVKLRFLQSLNKFSVKDEQTF